MVIKLLNNIYSAKFNNISKVLSLWMFFTASEYSYVRAYAHSGMHTYNRLINKVI